MDEQMTPAGRKSASKSNKPRRQIAAVAAMAAAVALAGVISAAVVNHSGSTSVVTSTIPSLAPADADTMVLAPYSAAWWKKVAAMAPPETALIRVDPETAGAPIKNIGYSRSQDHVQREIPMTGPYRLFYAEADSPEDTDKIAEWLKRADGFEGRRVYTKGNIVVVAPSWVAAFDAPEKSMADVAGYTSDLSGSQASMWRNPDQEIRSLAGSEDTTTGKALTAVMRNGFGFTSGTTWLGTSTDGAAWSGDFTNGGVDPAKINFEETRKVLDATAKTIGEVTDGNVKYQALSGGIGDILSSTTFRTPDKGTLGPQQSGRFPAVKDESVSVVSDVTGWSAASTGIYSSRENIGTQAVSANSTRMTIAYTYPAL